MCLAEDKNGSVGRSRQMIRAAGQRPWNYMLASQSFVDDYEHESFKRHRHSISKSIVLLRLHYCLRIFLEPCINILYYWCYLITSNRSPWSQFYHVSVVLLLWILILLLWLEQLISITVYLHRRIVCCIMFSCQCVIFVTWLYDIMCQSVRRH